MNKSGLIAVLALVLLVGAGAVWAMSSGNDEANPNTTTPATPEINQENQTPPTEEDEAEPNNDNTITYTNDGFSPANLSIAANTELTIVNNSSRTLDFASDPHPQHTGNSELNIGTIPSGQSQSVTLTDQGTWGYHDHLNPGQTGRIIVED